MNALTVSRKKLPFVKKRSFVFELIKVQKYFVLDVDTFHVNYQKDFKQYQSYIIIQALLKIEMFTKSCNL